MTTGSDNPNREFEQPLREIAEPFEIVLDLERPEELRVMVEIMTGVPPNVDQRFNAVLAALLKVDASAKACRNALVHKVLQLYMYSSGSST